MPESGDARTPSVGVAGPEPKLWGFERVSAKPFGNMAENAAENTASAVSSAAVASIAAPTDIVASASADVVASSSADVVASSIAASADVAFCSPQTIRVSGFVEESIVDGPGLRYVIFTQGCPHNCVGCHNPETHDPSGGTVVTVAAVTAEILENPVLSGVTFSGGEPFLQAQALCAVAEGVRAAGKSVVTYTGYTFEQLLARAPHEPAVAALLAATDILIDGPYLADLRDLELRFRGSSNQRLLDRAARANLFAVWSAGAA